MKIWMLIGVLLALVDAQGQNWTLHRCMDQAVLNNAKLRTSKLEIEKNQVSIDAAKNAFLPSLNGGASHGYNWGQTIDPFTNEFATSKVQYNNFYLNSSLELFSGMDKYYGVRQKELDYQIAEYNGQIEIRNLKMSIVTAYLQILLNQEILKVANTQLDLTQTHFKHVEKLVEAQQKTKSDLLQIEAQKAQDFYVIQKAVSELKLSKIKLQHLIGLKVDSTFSISTNLELNQDTILPNNTPLEIRLSKLKIEYQNLEILKTKKSLLPSLTLNGSLGSGYSENSKFLASNGALTPTPFKDQFRENFYQSVSLSLNAPLFNRNTIKHQLSLLNLELTKHQLELNNTVLEVEQKVEILQLDISNAREQLKASKIAHEYEQKNYENELLKFELGEINYIEIVQAKNRLFHKSSELIKNKYNLELKKLLLWIFRGN